ncbi:MAG: HPr family phosphocarrier protein [Chlamydiia bacterium]|nr:HPr family phosphocarrier protein [Chlamydiia bacterium]
MKVVRNVKVKNPLGLHTRPAATIVKLLQGYKSSVTFTCKNETINARSIMSILMLAARKNTVITITAEGIDSEAVVMRLISAFENEFGER